MPNTHWQATRVVLQKKKKTKKLKDLVFFIHQDKYHYQFE
jgi:hypothetical protein